MRLKWKSSYTNRVLFENTNYDTNSDSDAMEDRGQKHKRLKEEAARKKQREQEERKAKEKQERKLQRKMSSASGRMSVGSVARKVLF